MAGPTLPGSDLFAGAGLPERPVPGPALTDKYVRSITANGQRQEIFDAIQPQLLVRVGANGHQSFALLARFPGSRTPTRRALGPFYDGTPSVLQHQDPDILERDGAAHGLAEAREKARLWLGMIARQRDPAAEKRVALAAAEEKADQAARAAQTAFARVAVVWLERRIAGLKNELAIGKPIANEFTTRWKGRPIASICRDEMREAIKAIEARGAPWQGHVAWSAADVANAGTARAGPLDRSRLDRSPISGIPPAADAPAADAPAADASAADALKSDLNRKRGT